MAERGAVTVRRASDLDAILARPGRVRRVELALPGLAAERQAALQLRLAGALSACGCTEGSIALIAALPLAALLWWQTALGDSRWLLCLGLVLAATLAGKAVGHLRARRGLVRTIATIRQELAG